MPCRRERIVKRLDGCWKIGVILVLAAFAVMAHGAMPLGHAVVAFHAMPLGHAVMPLGAMVTAHGRMPLGHAVMPLGAMVTAHGRVTLGHAVMPLGAMRAPVRSAMVVVMMDMVHGAARQDETGTKKKRNC